MPDIPMPFPDASLCVGYTFPLEAGHSDARHPYAFLLTSCQRITGGSTVGGSTLGSPQPQPAT